MGQKHLFVKIMTDIFSELLKYIKPKIRKQSTKGKEKILYKQKKKKKKKKTNCLEKSDLHASQYQQWKPEAREVISVMK